MSLAEGLQGWRSRASPQTHCGLLTRVRSDPQPRAPASAREEPPVCVPQSQTNACISASNRLGIHSRGGYGVGHVWVSAPRPLQNAEGGMSGGWDTEPWYLPPWCPPQTCKCHLPVCCSAHSGPSLRRMYCTTLVLLLFSFLSGDLSKDDLSPPEGATCALTGEQKMEVFRKVWSPHCVTRIAGDALRL